MTTQITKKERNATVDLTKGVTILLVVIGHCLVIDGLARNVIFSFHMPIFFILYGYTSKPADTIQDLFTNTIKNLKRFIIPLTIICIFIDQYFYIISCDFSYDSFCEILLLSANKLFYGYPLPYNNKPGIGMIWFLLALFYAKIIIDFVHIYTKKHITFICYFGIALLGLLIGKEVWLWQCIDLAMVSVGFIAIGMLYKRYENVVDKYSVVLIIISIIFWYLCIHSHIYIEMAVRRYKHLVIPFIEAICACFVYIYVCKYISQNDILTKFFAYLGRNCFIIYLVHHCDLIFESIYKFDCIVATSISRTAVVLIVFTFIMALKDQLQKTYKSKDIKY